MTSLDLSENPFKVFTPEDMKATDVAELFVNPPDAIKMRGPGHTMLSGARGCGKSMIFRYLLSDCQRIALCKKLTELPFLSFLVSIKNAGPTPTLTEFLGLRDTHADLVLNEHVLTAFVTTKVFSALSRIELPDDPPSASEAREYFEKQFRTRLRRTGAKIEPATTADSAAAVFGHIATICDDQYSQVVQYVKRLTPDRLESYRGALWDYLDFLHPLLAELKHLSFLPSSPIYLLIDDADYLNEAQTMSLNSWISTRTQADVSIKVSTQLGYKTLRTVSGMPIQSPHDFQMINISDLYTTGRGRYRDRLEEIVAKRLKKARIDRTPSQFFPYDERQQKSIDAIADRIREKCAKESRDHRAADDVLRYARPEYIRSLGGRSKSTYTYSYSGFDQLVHISSGLVRYFLDSAARMFDEQSGLTPVRPVERVEPSVQDRITRFCADELALGEFDQIMADAGSTARMEGVDQLDDAHLKMVQLRNLIRALGGTFFLKLVSDDAERRVFSVAISGTSDPDVVSVLDLGVRYGYFHRSTIGNKEGTGRTWLYILTRRLAPHFKLDPSSFAGYLWVTNEAMRNAMSRPEAMLRRISSQGVSGFFEDSQLRLFED